MTKGIEVLSKDRKQVKMEMQTFGVLPGKGRDFAYFENAFNAARAKRQMTSFPQGVTKVTKVETYREEKRTD
eukprot:1148937-Pelagomonas_calceolata.AAC.13